MSDTSWGGATQAPSSDAETPAFWLPRAQLQRLLDLLTARGYRVLGPVVRDAALHFDTVTAVTDLAVGWRDEQSPGHYRLEHTDAPQVFGIVHGPGGIKRHVFAPREPLLQITMLHAEPDGPAPGFRAEARLPEPERVALLGVRACDLAGLAMQDRIFLHDRFPDPHYAARRAGLLLIAVGCTRAVSTCFCVSMGTGPAPTGGYDIAMTEMEDGFFARAYSDAGRDLLAALCLARVGVASRDRERDAFAACAESMTRALPHDSLRELLYDNLTHPRFDEVAARCLSCANCTLVCPTCFCHDVRDEPSLDGNASLRVREWDSCFNPEHAQVHGLNFRPHVRERYRQWLVHKLASWVDQFGASGCVGCGRCISWCPVGIDLTEEVAAIAATPGAKS
jgi:ferredoxin